MPAAPANNWTKMAAWLAKSPTKQSNLPEKEDEGTAASEGARSSENAKDTKTVVGGDSVEGGPKNPEHGRADNQGVHNGLEQATSDKGPTAGAKPTKTIEEENAKMSAADLSQDAQLAAAFASLQKAAAELPVLLASTGTPIPAAVKPAGQPAKTPESAKAAAEKAMLATVDLYSKYGSDQADLTVAYLRGYWDTYNHLKQAEDSGTLEQMLAGGGGGGGAPPAAGPPAAGPPAAPPPSDAGGGPPPPDAGPPGVDDQGAALGELGLSPQEIEQLIAILQQKLQSEQGQMAPAAKEAVAAALTKAASDVSAIKQHMQSGKFQFKPAADGSPERKRRNVARAYFEELRRAAS